MFNHLLKLCTVSLAVTLGAQIASAGVINAENYGNKYTGYNGAVSSGYLGGYSMTKFGVSGAPSSSVSSIFSPVDNQLVLLSDLNGNPVNHELANSTPWWSNTTSGGSAGDDYSIFTTHTRLIEIILPKNTLAFAFNVGASFRGTAWFNAYDQDGALDYQSGNFAVGGPRTNGYLTPGFGLYADNSGYGSASSSCNYISKVVVDPNDGWGVGNFSIAQDTNNSCGTVPVSEPSAIALALFGLFGLIYARRRKVN